MCGIVPAIRNTGVFPFTELTNVAIHIILVFIDILPKNKEKTTYGIYPKRFHLPCLWL